MLPLLQVPTPTLKFISGEIPSKLALAFLRSASVTGSWTSSSHEFEMFGLSYLVHKVNGIPLYNLSFEKSYRILYELTTRFLDQDSQLFENGITSTTLAKSHGIIVLDLSGTPDMGIVRMGSAGLECTFNKSLPESVALISLNHFETIWEITTNRGSTLLNLAP